VVIQLISTITCTQKSKIFVLVLRGKCIESAPIGQF